MIDALYFILRYIPWWAVPVLLISFQFANIYFTKEMHKLAWGFTFNCILSTAALAWYIYAGSPDKSVSLFNNLIGW